MKDKVVRHAHELGLAVEVQRLEDSTQSVEQAATAVGCVEAEIARCVVFVCDGEPVVCMVSGEHRIDPDKLAEIYDCAEVREAGPDEVRAATGFAAGAVPPVGHGLPLVIDEVLLRHRRVWAAAGDPQSLFCFDPRELVDCLDADVAEVAQVGTTA
jgi:prolyl-tRNA editing enzyme YbaK/EbsC (Cys-tRNA(Pro) deacylase)